MMFISGMQRSLFSLGFRWRCRGEDDAAGGRADRGYVKPGPESRRIVGTGPGGRWTVWTLHSSRPQRKEPTMSNRQAMPGADAKTNTSQPAHSEPTKQAGARTGAKANGRSAGGGDTSQGATKGGDWRGEEVSSSKVASSAEDAASRAEGNGPVRAGAAARDPISRTKTL